MVSIFIKGGASRRPITPDLYERFLAAAATLLLAAMVVALAKGRGQWGEVPVLVWTHLATIIVALALTPWMLLRPRGTRLHRQLGRLWVAAMVATAFISLFVQVIRPGHFTWIHILSIFVLIMAPRVWLTARAHNVAGHRGTVRGLVTGALVIAGYFTFPFDRLLGHWLFG
ncbi:DUF2306 domain-containing protein [uncultured Sphingomonas sp.]|uniref:DUF2306 domain-containing protein n=1 Tax=uncultured Sphingomonas sp. TaxID=158754 RepID=UPI0035C96A97